MIADRDGVIAEIYAAMEKMNQRLLWLVNIREPILCHDCAVHTYCPYRPA
ncbi:MAG: hypothetical protein IKR05_12895 [Prevotella sp.]|nr:hypothetical protein [Prevotella sp.]